MTRTTVYNGTPWDDEKGPVLADVFHNHENRQPVIVRTTGGQEFHIPGDEAVDIYIDGTPVDEEEP